MINQHDLQLCSYGGVATSFLLQFLISQGLNLPEESDSGIWKHMRQPPLRKQYGDYMGSNYRCVYLVGSPVEAVLSVFRRQFHVFHIDRMQVKKDSLPAHWNLANEHANWHLQDYVAERRDIFGLEAHFDNWTKSSSERDYQIFIVKFEKLWEYLPQLFDFLGLDSLAMQNFPKRRERRTGQFPILIPSSNKRGISYFTARSMWALGLSMPNFMKSLFKENLTYINHQDDEIMSELSEVYKDLIQKVDTFPDFKII
jgi:hypothetical protein